MGYVRLVDVRAVAETFNYMMINHLKDKRRKIENISSLSSFLCFVMKDGENIKNKFSQLK